MDLKNPLRTQVPLYVYLSEAESRGSGSGFHTIAEYGSEFKERRKPVRLLYVQGNHFDLLLR